MATTSSSAVENRRTFERVAREFWNERDYDVADDAYAEEIRLHTQTEPDVLEGVEAVKEFARRYHDAFSDFELELCDVRASDDVVYGRYAVRGTHDGTLRSPDGDIPATGERIELWGLVEARFEDGRCVEEWNSTDAATMASQLGLTPGIE
ncbi:ester cyclase [Halopelagius fulvigenes]|uniref:Ester cyclase n=1 Tax=Halopelagius fulvigenes TaxID=1198324 RepID=A0ABD5U461_9EURY